MQKKNVIVLISTAAVLIAAVVFLTKTGKLVPFRVLISQAETTEITTEIVTEPPTTEPPTTKAPIEVNCKAAILYCVEDNFILFEKAADKKIAPASITKLMTSLTALKYSDGEDVFKVGSELKLLHPNSSLCMLSKGQKLKLADLISGMLMVSGNDAAYTTAVNTARKVFPDEELNRADAILRFTELMNETASDIGMRNSNFTTPDGWDDEEQYTTVSDLVKLALASLQEPLIKTAAAQTTKNAVFETGETITWKNTNKLIDKKSEFYMPEASGLKTGTTGLAGCCVLSVLEKNGKTYICAVTGCTEDADRYLATQKIFKEYVQ